MRTRRSFVTTLLASARALAQDSSQASAPFLVKPYLQLGNNPSLKRSEELALLWHTSDTDAPWSVRTQPLSAEKWKTADRPRFHRIAVRSIEPHRVYTAALQDLPPGEPFRYEVLIGDKPVFAAESRARHAANQFYSFAVFGDCSQASPGQRAVAVQVHKAKPDFVFITGDIVYSRGRISEYRPKYFPIYNADTATADGVPLLRSTLFVAAPGNHDIASTDVEVNPDGLAYFYYWNQPLNGPLRTAGAPNTPILKGADADQKAFLEAAGSTYPVMASFSFDYGNAHWTVLDSNKTVDWTNPELLKWVKDDLRSARRATWRFVAFHHPGFNSSRAHFNDQWMRSLAPVFEEGGVSIVFNGHVHNYQRSYPLKFQPKLESYDPKTGALDGIGEHDMVYDGVTKTKPNGVIYLVTGAGGAGLYNPEQQTLPEQWQKFTHKFVSTVHSFTKVDVRDKELTIRQISATGDELDRFVVTK